MEYQTPQFTPLLKGVTTSSVVAMLYACILVHAVIFAHNTPQHLCLIYERCLFHNDLFSLI